MTGQAKLGLVKIDWSSRKIFGTKFFWLKIMFDPSKIMTAIFEANFFSTQKNLTQIFLELKLFWYKHFLEPKIFMELKLFLDPTLF